MAAALYVDTSAYLCVLLGEEGSEALEEDMTAGPLVSSVLLALEASRNLVRLSREGRLSPQTLRRCLARLDEDVERFTLRELTLDLCTGTTFPVVSTPRSLDLAHLRSALWFHRREPLLRFMSLDQNQLQSADELGLPT